MTAGPPAAALLRHAYPADPARELALSHALLQRAGGGAGELGRALRVYRPGPTVAFGRLDTLRPGFRRAVAAARAHGFAPVLRAPGGHAAAYHDGCLCLDEVAADPDPVTGMRARFASRGELLAGALRELGVDARVGEVPGEYCPGAFSVNARGAVKLAGTAQRVTRRAWLFGSVVVVEDPEPLLAVLGAVYAALGLAWDPRAFGTVAAEAPGVTVAAVERSALRAYGEHLAPAPAEPDAGTLALAGRLRGGHALPGER